MVWGGISWGGKTPLVVVENTIDAEEYVKMLESKYQSWVKNTYPNGAFLSKMCFCTYG